MADKPVKEVRMAGRSGGLREKTVPAETWDRLTLSASETAKPVELRARRSYPLLTDPGSEDAAESFAVLRSRLLNARSKSGVHSILVASPMKEEGKSLISMNLAISLAQLGRDRILLVDGDLRVRGISNALELGEIRGLGDFLQRPTPFESCTRVTTLPHLYVTPAGDAPERLLPALLESPRLVEFLDRAKRDFGLIIVDSVPASAPMADFELLLAACDFALLVVQLRKTTRGALDATLARMGDKLLGTIVNNAETRADDYRYYRSRNNRKTVAGN